MKRVETSLFSLLQWSGVVILVLSNVVVVLPDAWTFLQLCPLSMSPAGLALEWDPSGQSGLVLEDVGNKFVANAPTVNVDTSVVALDSFIHEQRVQHVVRMASITVEIAKARTEQPERVTMAPSELLYSRTYEAQAVWCPIRQSRFRFELKNAVDIIPGEYTVRAKLHVPARWSPDGPWTEMELIQMGRPFWPGTILLREATTPELRLVITGADASTAN